LALGINPGLAKVIGLFDGLITIVAGFVNAFADATGSDDPPQVVSTLQTVCGMAGFLIGFPLASSSSPDVPTWVNWGVAGAMAGVSILGIPDSKTYPNLGNFRTIFAPLQTAVLGGTQLALFIVDFVEQHKTDFVNDAEFGMNIALALDAIINPFKLLGAETDGIAPVIVACVDGIVGFVIGALTILINLDPDAVTA
jgi:hypothetical protein